jgi:hypothetical protein
MHRELGLESNGIDQTSTLCTSLIGLRYGGQGIVNPSLAPAIAVGLAAGVLVGLLSFAVLRRRRGTGSSTAMQSENVTPPVNGTR